MVIVRPFQNLYLQVHVTLCSMHVQLLCCHALVVSIGILQIGLRARHKQMALSTNYRSTGCLTTAHHAAAPNNCTRCVPYTLKPMEKAIDTDTSHNMRGGWLRRRDVSSDWMAELSGDDAFSRGDDRDPGHLLLVLRAMHWRTTFIKTW